MIRISSDTTILSMSSRHKPVAKANSGERIVFQTLDCYSNMLKNEQELLSNVPWERINPATGPLFIESAEVGDILKVEILDIKLADSAVAAVGPELGVFGKGLENEVTRIMPIKEGRLHFNDKIILPVRPMIGVIGTAPGDGLDIPTGTPGPHGGNMDCKEIMKGTTLYLPVNVEGALLSMGDLHASMGDGEVSICGAEVAGEIMARVSVVKKADLPLPLLLTETKVMTIYSAADLDKAAEGATTAMHRFVCGRLGLDYVEAVMLLSTIADLCICQIVDPLKTCRMEFPLSIARRYGYSPD